jgi:predicted negative regulator of RcsB-dependent stress response
MAASEDELAKQRVQEAVWMWTGRLLVLAVVFGFGFFTGWLLWGSGLQGAPALRDEVVKQQSQITELRKQRADQEGQATVCKGRLDQCYGELAKARSAGTGGGGATP